MAINTEKTYSFARFLISFCVALAVAGLLAFYLSGPKLGPKLGICFDLLLQRTRGQERANEILLIETDMADSVIEPQAAAAVVLSLAEMRARSLVIESPVLGISISSAANREELLSLFNTEFDMISSNIKNLFDGIRMGTVAPSQTSSLVGSLLSLTEEGKKRLLNAAVRDEERGALELDRAALAFSAGGGIVRIADDLSVEVVRQGGNLSSRRQGRAVPLYSRAAPDKDGVLRRIIPQHDGEHIVYNVLRSRFPDIDGRFELDAGGAIILMPLAGNKELSNQMSESQSFRTVRLAEFLDFHAKDDELYRILAAAPDLAPYGKISPEKFPPYIFELERATRREVMETGSSYLYAKWLDARRGYFDALEAFFYGENTEANIEEGFALLLEKENLRADGRAKLETMKQELLTGFRAGKNAYNQLSIMKNALAAKLDGAFCILGPKENIQSSGLLANTILTGAYIRPSRLHLSFWLAAAAALLVLLIIKSLGPIFTLIFGTLLSAGVFVGASSAFIFTSFWLDPLLPAAACMAGTVAQSLGGFLVRRRLAARRRSAFGPFVAENYLRALNRAGKPRLEDKISVQCAVIAIKNPALTSLENNLPPEKAAEASIAFREKVREIWTRAGAVIAGAGGDTVVAVLGAPLERIAGSQMKGEMPYDDEERPRGAHSPVPKAAGFLLELVKNDAECAAWCYGIDSGKAAFTWTDLTGYSGFGRPIVRAKALASFCTRYKCKVLVTSAAAKKIDGALMRKLDALSEQGSDEKEPFYELIVRNG